MPRSTPKRVIQGKKKIGFVCSGGGAKAGAFHLGVALALQEQGFRFVGGMVPPAGSGVGGEAIKAAEPRPMDISVYVGSSAGSIIATLLASGYSLEAIFHSFLSEKGEEADLPKGERTLARMTYSKMFRLRPELPREQIKQLFLIKDILRSLMEGKFESLLLFKMLKISGIFSTGGIEQYLREEVLISNSFQDYIPELYVVGTQLNHSKKVIFGKNSFPPPPHDPHCMYFTQGKISEACAASAAIPLVFAPYPIEMSPGADPVFFIDGEIRDTMSSHVAVDAGADLIIASYTHQPYHLVKEIGSLTNYGIPAILIQSLYLVIEQKINHYIHTKKSQRAALESVMAYCRENNLPEQHTRRILEILEKELSHRMEVDMIYVHPSPHDHRMFMKENFSLNPQRMWEIVKSGFKAAVETLRKYEFADLPNQGKGPKS